MDDHEQEKSTSGFVFKVLNGSLHGIEFSLGFEDYFICVGDAQSQQKNLAFAERTLYFPSNESKNNFVVNLSNLISDDHFEVTVCYATHSDIRNLPFNRICEVEGVYFSIKREGEAWCEEVQKGILPAPEDGNSGGLNRSGALVNTGSISATSKKLAVCAFTFVLISVIGAMVGWNYYYVVPAVSTATANQFQQLVGDRAGYSVHLGSDNINYLFSSSLQQADWARQAVARKSLTAKWRVVTPQTEEMRLASVLERHNVAFFAIRFIDPSNPTLLLSRTRNATDQASLKNVIQIMLSQMPYARNVNIVLYDDDEVLNKAQQGLKALGFEYQTIKSESGVTLSSWMPSVDVHLSEFGRFVSNFYQTWGQRYVHFSADIHDDLLKDKSYKCMRPAAPPFQSADLLLNA